MMKDLISIVVPVYNAEKTINRCVGSIINQKYKNIEIILVNDGSNDNSLAICEQYAKQDYRIIVINKSNEGVSSTRNVGIDAAHGKYIMFCDSDDWVYDDYCSYMLEHIEPNKLVMCGYEEIKYPNQRINSLNRVDIVQELTKQHFLRYREIGIGSPCNKIFDLSIVKENKIRFPKSISLGEDLAFVVEYLKYVDDKIIYLPRKLYVYQNENLVSLSKNAPSLEANEAFYLILTDAIEVLADNKIEMMALRNSIIMYDYEKSIISIVQNKKKIWWQYREIRRATKSIAYRNCCVDGVESKNKLYNWMFKKGKTLCILLYFKLRR